MQGEHFYSATGITESQGANTYIYELLRLGM